MGGAFHDILVQGAAAGALSFLLFFGGLAWSEAGRTTDGSILAARLRERLPHVAWIASAALLWYVVAEAIEPQHAAASPIAVLAVVGAAAWLIALIARGILAAVAGAIIAALRPAYSARTPFWKRRARLQPTARRLLWSRRRFARPPPIEIVALRA